MSDVKNSALATNLVSYWELEEASGTRVDSHAGNDLTDNNTVGQAVGIQGNAADFESSNSEYLRVVSPSGITSAVAYSVSFWVKFESTGTQSMVSIIGAADTQNKATFFLIGSKFYFRRNHSGGTILDVVSPSTYTTATWYHVVGTFSTTNGMNLYVNGSSVATSGVTTATDFYTWNINLGARFRASADIYTDGIIDEVSVWDGRELTSTDVSSLYNSGSGIPYDAGGGANTTNFFYMMS